MSIVSRNPPSDARSLLQTPSDLLDTSALFVQLQSPLHPLEATRSTVPGLTSSLVDRTGSSPAMATNIEEETRQLASFAVYFNIAPLPAAVIAGATEIGGESRQIQRRPRPRPARSDVEKCLQNCILRMLEKHRIVFNGMMNRLNISRSTDFDKGFRDVSEELFRDEVRYVAYF